MLAVEEEHDHWTEPHEHEQEENFSFDDLPDLEICDGINNDGDSEIDEGCTDIDSDNIIDTLDNCPQTPNADQADQDSNYLGDACQNPVVSNLRIESQTDTSVTLAWEGTTKDVLGFNVYRQHASETAPNFLGSSYPTTTDTTLTDYISPYVVNQYIYYVYPINLNNNEGSGTSFGEGVLNTFLPVIHR